MSQCRHFLVAGHVQGVFYRTSTEHMARRLGLGGWVCNLPDGNVELVACGDETKLKELENWLWQGPRHARVAQVVARDVEPQSYPDFSVR